MKKKSGPPRILTVFTETFGLGRTAAFCAIAMIGLVAGLAAFWFFKSAPPKTLTITSGPEGSGFRTNAEKYRIILERSRVNLRILPSQGSMHNLLRLTDPLVDVDIGFVQGGMTNAPYLDKLMSLGSIAYQPLLVFYRGTATVEMLSAFKGQRLAIGQAGSGAHSLALILLATNGIEPGGTTKLEDLDGGAAAKGLLAGEVDAVFLMGDSASSAVMRQLLRNPDIHLMSFSQADAYTRKFRFLNKLDLPKGSIDFGSNIPARDVYLIGPTVELIARQNLHPALSDLLLEAAREIHGNASLLQKRAEFPAPLEHDIRISQDANRFYKSGKTFLYRHLPFWMASLVNRVLVVFVPAAVLLIPALRLIPAVFRLRVKLRLYRWYRALLLLEKDMLSHPEGMRDELLRRLDNIEATVNQMKVPASFADQFYGLRGHIHFVRERLLGTAPTR